MHPDLTEYRQRVTTVGPDDTYKDVPFNNLAPLLLKQDPATCVLRQTGRALVWFGRMIAPAPLVESPVFLEKPKVEYHRVEDKPWARETTWEYVMAVDAAFLADFDAIAAEAWPADPEIVSP